MQEELWVIQHHSYQSKLDSVGQRYTFSPAYKPTGILTLYSSATGLMLDMS